MKSFFAPREVQQLVDITYRQIEYWDKSHFIIPSYRRRGKYRLYTFGDLILLKVAETLKKEGESIQGLRSILGNLKDLMREVTFPFSELNILFDRKKKGMIIFNGDVVATSLDDYVQFSVRDLRKKLYELYESNDASVNAGMRRDCAAYLKPVTKGEIVQIGGHKHHKAIQSGENICDIVSNYKI